MNTLKQHFPLWGCGLVFLLTAVVYPSPVLSIENNFSKEETVLLSNFLGITAITAWGVLNWDYFDTCVHKTDEGWFSRSTRYGGQDKLGHFYSSYVLTHGLSSFFKHTGYSTTQAGFIGSLSSFAITSWMEFGDAFSPHGFSYEDFTMNLFGSITGYLLYTKPALSKKIDIRYEYLPQFDKIDFTTDYDHQKYLIAVKLDGFDAGRDSPLKYFELQLGYYTRGYPDKTDRQRVLYFGIGLNLSRIFKQLSMPVTAKVFNYIQVPYTYITKDRHLD